MTSARPECSHCLRPLPHCLCGHLIQMHSPVAVSIWQHPTEAEQRFKTAHLAALQLGPCHIVVGEVIARSEIQTRPRVALIYRDAESKTLAPEVAQQYDQFLFLDGTWDKTKRLIHLNPWLRDLEMFHLPETQAVSKLAPLRKTHQDGALSTLEAVATTLCTYDESEEFQQITKVLDYWVQLQQSYVPKS